MPITPDDKDWTWVLDRPCPECGFDASTVSPHAVAGLIRDNVMAWQAILASRSGLNRRPSDDRWSTLEYSCHVRDVFRLYDQRLELMLTEDGPTYPNWDQDVTAVTDRYNEQDPAKVSVELGDAGARLADRFDTVTDWRRRGTRSDGAQFSVESFARYRVHDPVHHLHDVVLSST